MSEFTCIKAKRLKKVATCLFFHFTQKTNRNVQQQVLKSFMCRVVTFSVKYWNSENSCGEQKRFKKKLACSFGTCKFPLVTFCGGQFTEGRVNIVERQHKYWLDIEEPPNKSLQTSRIYYFSTAKKLVCRGGKSLPTTVLVQWKIQIFIFSYLLEIKKNLSK